MFGGKMKVRIGRLDLLAIACEDSQTAFGALKQCPVSVKLMDRDGAAVWAGTWSSDRTPPEGGWDWAEIARNSNRTTDEFCIAIWHADTMLCGVFHIIVSGSAVQVYAVEGNPDENHPLKGSVSAIGVDVAERFAGLLRKTEIWLVEPADGLLDLYTQVLQFELHDDNGRRICKRRV